MSNVVNQKSIIDARLRRVRLVHNAHAMMHEQSYSVFDIECDNVTMSDMITQSTTV